MITVLLSFPVTYLLLRQRISTYACLVGGTFLQSFCPLALLWTSYGSTLAFVVIMAFGEAIWSPRLYEYSTMVAPEGFEGTFVAVAFVPQYVSAGVVGVSSGVLLDTFVPDRDTLEPGEQMRPHMLWGIVAAASFVTPLMLVCLRSSLFGEEPTLASSPRAAVTTAPGTGGGRGRGKYATMQGSDMDMVAADEGGGAAELPEEDDSEGILE